MRSDFRWLTPALALVLAGCGGSEFPMASVSGRITLDGEPVEYAAVVFTPKRTGDSVVVGPRSAGETDADGRFELQTIKGDNGAVVGPHAVTVSTYEARLINPRKSDEIEVIAEEVIPRRYRAPSELTFEVPSGGSSEANFDLQSR